MVENCIGTIQIPLGVATNFRVNGRDVLVPMATEEPSVIAAASKMAKGCLPEGVQSSVLSTVSIGQIHFEPPACRESAEAFAADLNDRSKDILVCANKQDPVLVGAGGGCVRVVTRIVSTFELFRVVLHLHVDTRDANGANAVNTMVEAVASYIKESVRAEFTPLLRIVSNLATERLVHARAVWPASYLGGVDVVDRIVAATACATHDPYRAATHNKGIMNGIVAVCLATGQDTRAVEASAHSFAWHTASARGASLTSWHRSPDRALVGEIRVPLPVASVGGALASMPSARTALKIMGVEGQGGGAALAEVLAAVGLVQNLAALRALVSEGIQQGHMKLHATNILRANGATNDEVGAVMLAAAEREDAPSSSSLLGLLYQVRARKHP
jgi:hydroxymethylglutaryl-CoA reductase